MSASSMYIASQENGCLCRDPATILGPQRGGMVCRRHDPNRADRFEWEEGDITIRYPVQFAYTRQELETLFRLADEEDVEKGGRYDARSAAINVWSHH